MECCMPIRIQMNENELTSVMTRLVSCSTAIRPSNSCGVMVLNWER